jgi:Trk K+ transport system NAD-binding subunit
MRVVILGGSTLGRLLADSLMSSLVLEPSLSSAVDLAHRYGRDRVLVGDPKDDGVLVWAGVDMADVVIVTTGKDADNLTIAKQVRALSRCRIIVEASDPVNVQLLRDMGFEDVLSPEMSAAQHILALIQPESHEVSELYVTDGSPLKGKKINELILPKGVMIAGILRQDRLVGLTQTDTLGKGDHLILFSPSGSAPIEALISESRIEMRPFKEIAVLMDESKGSESMLKEMSGLAKDIHASLRLVSSGDQLLREARQLADAWEVPVTTVHLEVGALVNPAGTAQQLHLEEGCLALQMNKALTKGFLAKRRVKDLISSTPQPIIISRGTYPYRRILALVDMSWRDGKLAETTGKLAIACKADLDLLREADSIEAGEEVRHIKRLARSFGVQVRDVAIEGNPTVELVSMIRSGRYDLAALEWGCRLLKKDIIRRVVFESPISILVKGKGACDLPFRP